MNFNAGNQSDVFTVETCQKLSLLIINFLLPSLIFYNVVNSLSINEIKTIASLALSAFIFEAIGLIFGLIVRFTTPNPRRWFGGIMAAGAFNNSSDLPIAYVTTLAASSFFPQDAASRGTAYAVIYMVVFCVSVFNLGGFKLIASDCQMAKFPENKEISQPILSEILRQLHLKCCGSNSASESCDNYALSRISSHSIGSINDHHTAFYEANQHPALKPASSASGISAVGNATTTQSLFGASTSRNRRDSQSAVSQSAASQSAASHKSKLPPDSDLPLDRIQTLEDVVKSYSRNGNNAPELSHQIDIDDVMDEHDHCEPSSRSKSIKQWFKRHKIMFVYEFIVDFKRPQSLAMIISLICALVPQIRALFKLPDTPSNIPNAPDDLPCLDFIMSFGKFIGAASVPLGLAILGATIARLKLTNLPKGFWKSMIVMSSLKLIVLPIIAIKWSQKMRDMNWIDTNDNMALIVTVVTSAVPTATSQLYITAMFTNSEVDHLQMDCTAAYLISQYSMLVFTLTFIITYLLLVIIDI